VFDCRRQFEGKLAADRLSIVLLSVFLLLACATAAEAQSGGFNGLYQPLNQLTPPGTAGYWAGALGRASDRFFQPIHVQLPSTGIVTFYDGTAQRPVSLSTPALAGVAVGRIYRLRISDMPEYPGIELYPSIEILDRLHPPPGKKYDFPVPVQLTAEEIDLALQGRLVTKVMYLEQPQLASPQPIEVRTVPSHRNLLADADRLGRPMLIIRVGGRLPDPQGDDPGFFGTGARVSLPANQPAARPMSRSSKSIKLFPPAADRNRTGSGRASVRTNSYRLENPAGTSE